MAFQRNDSLGLVSRIVDDLQLLFRRPARIQFAALCYRGSSATGDLEVLLITSRDTGRWVIPKGWPMEGRMAYEAAAREAFEEAGVIGDAEEEPLGTYHYQKRLDNGMHTECHVQVHAIKVAKLEDEFPERNQRTREWVVPDVAAERVREPALSDLIRSLPERL